MADANLEQTYPVDLFASESGAKDELVGWTKSELEALKQGHKKRKDGRALDEFRPICINAGISSTADGSAYAELGNTKVYCTVNGPHEVSRGDITAETSWRAQLMVKVTYAPFALRSRIKRQRSDQETVEERTYGLALMDALIPLLLLDKYPRSQIDLLVMVIEDDGGVLPLALTASSVAFTNAGIEMYDVVVAASLMAVEGHGILDPNSEECLRPVSASGSNDSTNIVEKANITVSLMPALNQVVCVNQDGQLKPKSFSQAMKTLFDACYQQYPVVQEAITKMVRRQRSTSAQKSI